jgi:serine/threonine protein phosphatase PrpC
MSIHLAVCGLTDVGLVRETNEDAMVITDLSGEARLGAAPGAGLEIRERGILLAVSDGMGGHNAGEVASALVVESLQRAMTAPPASPRDDVAFERAVQSVNRQVWEAARLPGRNKDMGATLTAVFLRGATATIAEVGDSRAYLLRGGRLVQVTHDQSFVQMLVDAGALTPEDAVDAPYKNVVLQAMGQGPDVQVALGRLELRQGDCFLLCSDGLTNELRPSEIQDAILRAPRLDAACATLIELAKQRGGRDNITVVLGCVSGQLPELAPGEPVSGALQRLKEFDAPGYTHARP